VVPHELEHVEEEDEDQLAEEERRGREDHLLEGEKQKEENRERRRVMRSPQARCLFFGPDDSDKNYLILVLNRLNMRQQRKGYKKKWQL
jgi:hypothetical protein